MNFIDRMRAYLNEEDIEDEEPTSKEESANGRVRLQAIDEVKDENPVRERRNIRFVDETGEHDSKKTTNAAGKKPVRATGTSNQTRNAQSKDARQRKPAYNNSFIARNSANAGEQPKKSAARTKAEKRLRKALDKRSRQLDRQKKSVRTSTQTLDNRRGQRIRSENANVDSLINKKTSSAEAEKQIVTDFCDQLVDVTYHMEDMRQEYKIVSNYLMDIQRIDELPVDYANDIVATAGNIIKLDNNRENYLKSENLLTEDRYSVLAQLEKEVPGTIRKLYDMEMRDSMLKSDMGHLEGEKEDLKYIKEEYVGSIDRIRNLLMTILILCIIAVGVVAAISIYNKSDVLVYVLAVGAVVMVAFAIGYARYVSVKDSARLNDAMLARAVSLLNKVKVKYINNTNALDYIYDKYGVHSSSELEFQWQQYNTMVRDLLRYSDTNKELRKQREELVNKLKRLGIAEPSVWVNQVSALVNRDEFMEIRHNLNQRRGKLRDNIASCEKIRDNAITALRAAVAENPGLIEIINDILGPYHISILNK